MKVNSSFLSDIGRKREANEDSLLARDDLGLYIVADGMGGHSCGDVASKTTIEVITTMMESAMKKGDLKKKAGISFLESVKLANRAVWEISKNSAQCRGMGTTIAGIVLEGKDKKFTTCHVGDSRIYLLRGGKINQLVRDHSLVEEELKAGLITAEEARTSSRKNIITRALGLEEEVAIEVNEFDYKKDDKVLICSDGLNDLVDDKRIADIVNSEDDILDATKKLVDEANLSGGRDNISVVMVQF